MTRTRAIKRTPALAFPEIAVADAAAIKAINRGEATPEQQQRALAWIMKKACMIGSLPFDLDSDRVSNLNMGRQFVGLQIVYILNEPITTFETSKEKPQ